MLQSLKGPTEKGRFQRVAWTDLNRTLISAGEDGHVRRWDVEVRRCAWHYRCHLRSGLCQRAGTLPAYMYKGACGRPSIRGTGGSCLSGCVSIN